MGDIEERAGRVSSQTDYSVELGIALYRCRLERGLSLRVLAKQLGLSSHSSIVDYEKSRRIPPENLLSAYEEVFELPADSLQKLRRDILAERAGHKVEQRFPEPAPARNGPARRLLTWCRSLRHR